MELEGTTYRCADMVAAQAEAFRTILGGSRMVRGEVHEARIISPGVGVLHARVAVLMPGEEEPPPTRTSMQLFVTVWRDDRWVVVAPENARVLSLDAMMTPESLAGR